MAKYHLKPSGEPGRCSAFLRPCPLGASEEEHYASPEQAREAYEAKMVEAVVASRAAREHSLEDIEDSRAVLATFNAMATPEAIAAWRSEPVNSFKWRLARMVELRETGERGYDDDVEFANNVMMSAAGERSGLSSNIRKWAKELVDWEMADELNRRYNERLVALPLEPSVTYDPYRVDPNSRHSPATLKAGVEKAKEDLAFVAPLCETYDKRFWPNRNA